MESSEAACEKQGEKAQQHQTDVDGGAAGRQGAADGGSVGLVRELHAEVGRGPVEREDAGGDGDGLGNGGEDHEAKVAAVVAQADVVAKPRAVVVEAAHAVVTGGAMAGTRWPPNAAGVAEFECDRAGGVRDDALARGGECDDGWRKKVGPRNDAWVGGGCQVGGQYGDGEGGDHGDE